MDTRVIDDLTATRIVHLLITPYNQWDAFKFGVIDNTGREIRPARTQNEQNSWNRLHKLIVRLRSLMQNSPNIRKIVYPSQAGEYFMGDKTVPAAAFATYNPSNRAFLPAYAAAFNTIKECIETDSFINESSYIVNFYKTTEEQMRLFEETGVAVAAGIAPATDGKVEPIVSKLAQAKHKAKQIALVRRNPIDNDQK